MTGEAYAKFLEQVQRETIPKLNAFTVVLGCQLEDHDEPAPRIDRYKGTGILVQVNDGNTFGILTAAHVVNALERSPSHRDPGRIIVVLSTNSEQGATSTTLAQATLDLPQHTITAEGRSNNAAHGPDLAWIPLSVEQAIELQSRRFSFGIFYNKAKSDREVGEVVEIWKEQRNIAQKTNNANDVCYVLGWSQKLQGPTDDNGLRILAFQALLEHKWVEAGWYYEDYQIGSRSKARPRSEYREGNIHVGFNYPDSLGGISGGGVWRIAERPSESGRLVHHLEGITFYEFRDEKKRYLRAHGFLSIIRILNQSGSHGRNILNKEDWSEMLNRYPDP